MSDWDHIAGAGACNQDDYMDYMDGPDCYRPPRKISPRPIRCKYCFKEEGLSWRYDKNGRPRLCEKDGTPHICKEYYERKRK